MKDWEVAQEALRCLEQDGWGTGSFGASGEPHCVVGALLKVTDGLWHAVWVANKLAAQLQVGNAMNLMYWNDRIATKETVFAALHLFIANEKAKEAADEMAKQELAYHQFRRNLDRQLPVCLDALGPGALQGEDAEVRGEIEAIT